MSKLVSLNPIHEFVDARNGKNKMEKVCKLVLELNLKFKTMRARTNECDHDAYPK